MRSSEMEPPFRVLLPQGDSAAKPLVVALGWAGSNDRLLLKYCDLLAGMGCATVRGTLPIDALLSPLDRGRRNFCIALLDFLQQQGLGSRRLVFYCFSNGGAFVLYQLLPVVWGERPGKYSNVRHLLCGLVMDSAPCYLHPGGALRVLHEVMPPGPMKPLALLWQRLFPSFSAEQGAKFWAAMSSTELGAVPWLVLYSNDDHLCDAAKLTELIETKRHRGDDVEWRRWEHSKHVTHMHLHRDEYVAALRSFLERKAAPVAAAKL